MAVNKATVIVGYCDCGLQKLRNTEKGSLRSLKINADIKILGNLATNIQEIASPAGESPLKKGEYQCRAYNTTHQH